MLLNKPDNREQGFLSALAKISSHIKQKDFEITDGRKILETICASTGANCTALYKRLYLTDSCFCLERLGSFSTMSGQLKSELPPKLTQETTSFEDWKQLNKKSAGYLIGRQNFDESLTNIYTLPLFFEDDHYGNLVLAGLQLTNDNEALKDFFASVCNVLELLISKSNLNKRFNDIFDFFPNPSFIMKSDEKVVYWNKANEELTGWKGSRIINKGNYTSSLPYYGTRRPMIANLIMRPDSEWQSTYPEYVQEGDDVKGLGYCPALPGGHSYLRANTTRLYDINNRLWGAIHSVIDVTLERKMREHLKRSESMYKMITDFAGVGILLLRDDEIIYSN